MLRKFGYGLGVFGPMLGWVAALQYLMYFYTEVVGLPPQSAGLIFLIGMVWDAISDPLIGAIADRTNTRWGRYRPYLLFGAVPYGLSIALLFSPSAAFSGNVFLIALVTHLLFRTGYTVVYMPYTAMIARLTTGYDARTDLTAFKTFFVFCGNLAVSFGFYALVLKLGDGDESGGFLPAAILVGCIATSTILLCFLFTEEKDVRLTSTPRTPPTITEITKDLLANRPFLLVFAGVAIFGGLYGVELAMIPYFAKYWFNDPSVSRTLFTTQAVMSLLSIPMWLFLARRYGKRFVWVAGSTLAALCLIAIFAIASTSVWLTALLYGLSNLGATGFLLVFYAMTADTVDWGEWKTGRRQEGVVFGAISFANKFAAGIATGGLGVALATIGFVSDQAQGPATLDGMRVVGLLLPATAFLISALLMTRYPLSRQVHEEILSGENVVAGDVSND